MKVKTAKAPQPVKGSSKSSKPAPKASTAKTVAAKEPPAKAPLASKDRKSVAKPVIKPPAKPAPKPASAKTMAKPAAKPAMVRAEVAKPLAKPVVVVAPAPAAVPPAMTQRPGRPSSRLASLTVPSMAQSVASTAAKASFSQLSSTPAIVPPLPSAVVRDPKLVNNWKSKRAEDLSDAELLAMPDSEYMNDKQMAAFRLKLSVLKKDILNSAGETTEHLREDTVVVPDPADRATIEEEHALELRTRDRERKLLKKIEQSINRIDSGDYGYCDETGEPIGVGRLLARPTATLSLEAQQRRELKQKMFGD